MNNVTRRQWILESAYFKSEARGFAPGRELDDWLAAENDYAKMQVAVYLELAEEDGITLIGLHRLAESVGVRHHEKIYLKVELVQAIQVATNYRPCFRADSDITCIGIDCKWKAECKKLIAEWCPIDE